MTVAVVAVVVVTALGFGSTFHSDEWEFIARRSLSDPSSLLRSYNEQWVTVPLVIYRLIFAFVGLHSYVPYLLVLAVLHACVGLVVYVVVRRQSGDPLACVATAIVLIAGYGFENLFWAFQIGMVSATLFGLLALELAARRDPRNWLVCVLLVASLASHAVGTSFLVACGMVALADRRSSAVSWSALAGLVFVAWLGAFGLPQLSARGGTLAEGIPNIPSFVFLGLGNVAASLVGLRPDVGPILLGLLVIGALAIRRRPALPGVVMAAAAGLVVEYALVAISRSQLYGDEATTWSRYLYVGAIFMLVGLSAWVGQVDLPRGRIRFAVAGLIVSLALVGNVRLLWLGRENFLRRADLTLGTVAVVVSFEDLPAIEVDQLPVPSVLRTLIEEHGSPARDDLLGASLRPRQEGIDFACAGFFVDDIARREACVSRLRSGSPSE
jgi:hypothetical protein